MAEAMPELASQWHPTLNGRHTPENVGAGSALSIWWLADCCGLEWQERVAYRDKRPRLRCPRCQTILGSLAWQDPGLAAEWSTNNSLTAWQVRPTSTLRFTPEWVCSVDPAHVWTMPLPSRGNGADCPECRQFGKSRPELDCFEAAIVTFPGTIRSGAILRSPAFTTRDMWTGDIVVEDAGRPRLVIEYDGAYWHGPDAKAQVDRRKTLDFLASGWLVVRLREDGLYPLDIDHPNYHEERVYSAAARPQHTMERIKSWADGHGWA
ncbi:MAG: hypothetical protein LBK42_00280 [Propionibacteriaceae bacterium]|nr:hypothetical protein [Propionibacteriaceae bacterium]